MKACYNVVSLSDSLPIEVPAARDTICAMMRREAGAWREESLEPHPPQPRPITISSHRLPLPRRG